MQVALLTPEEMAMARPPIAWPTLLVFVTSCLLVLFPPLLTFHAPSLTTVPVSTVAVYLLFTPWHEAVHGSVSVRYKWLNGVVGRISGVIFQAPFPAWRWIHNQHHKYTNDPVKDP
jgi:fatty acid desaturase